jgi:hypothetical protein
MKRFFCTICKRIKRVQSFPLDVVLSNSVKSRIGTCDYHSNPLIAQQFSRAKLHAIRRAEMKSNKSTSSTNQVNSKKRKVS